MLLDINAHPDRLDLDDVHVRAAPDAGVRRFGVDQARRGWCTAAEFANTRSLAKFEALLRRWSVRPARRFSSAEEGLPVS